MKEGIAVVSLMFPRRSLWPLALVAAAAATGLTAVPGAAGQVRAREWWLSEVHVTKAWQLSRGAGVTVAVLDTGVDPAQPDLSASVISGPDYTRSGRQPGGARWGVHGTSVATLIAGHGHGPGHADGIMGVAPRARILSVRVTLEEADPLRGDTALASRMPAAIAAGIRYAVRRGAMVIDLPLDPGAAGDGTPGVSAAAGGSSAERKAVSYALSHGAVLIAPAGDDGTGPGQPDYPAAYPGVISVGAFDRAFTKARFSSRGAYVTLTAPGSGVITAAPAASYTTVSSTSAASALVAGMAALIRARYPGLTPRQIGQALTHGTRFRPTGGTRNGSGAGTADAAGALAAATRIEAAMRAVSATAPGAGRPAGATAAHGSVPVARDALIGGTGLLLLLALTLIAGFGRRSKRIAAAPPGRHQARLRGALDAPPPAGASQPAQPWAMPAIEPLRLQLGPAPVGGAPAPPGPAGPPWEPAPRPEGESPWGALAPAANGNGAATGHAYPAAGGNGRADADRRASREPRALEPPAQRDPAGRPAGGAPASDGRSFAGDRREVTGMAAGGAAPYGAADSGDPRWHGSPAGRGAPPEHGAPDGARDAISGEPAAPLPDAWNPRAQTVAFPVIWSASQPVADVAGGPSSAPPLVHPGSAATGPPAHTGSAATGPPGQPGHPAAPNGTAGSPAAAPLPELGSFFGDDFFDDDEEDRHL